MDELKSIYPKPYIIKEEDNSFCIMGPSSLNLLAKLQTKDWETSFFKRKFGYLIVNYGSLDSANDGALYDALNALIKCGDENQYDLLECHLDIQAFNAIPTIEDLGFRLVDTRIRFITLMDKDNIEHFSTDKGDIGFATKSDLNDIIRLTHHRLTNNPLFFSRFKNRDYFTQEESRNYFSTWITNHLEDKHSFFAVLKDKGRVVGYFIYKRAELYKGKQLYKGILTAVAPEYQGSKAHLVMQSFLYDHFPDNHFYLENTTQLTNYPIIKNHIRSKKSFNSISLIFFRSF